MLDHVVACDSCKRRASTISNTRSFQRIALLTNEQALPWAPVVEKPYDAAALLDAVRPALKAG